MAAIKSHLDSDRIIKTVVGKKNDGQ